MIERNYGILASIDWNSNKWKEIPTSEDIEKCNYGYVIEKGFTHTCLNFGHEVYPADDQGYYYGLLPQLWSKSLNSENSKYVEIAFIKAQNWKDRQNYIVGFYAFPLFQKCVRPSPIKTFPRDFELNIKARPKDIHLLDNYVNVNSHSDFRKFLPDGKELGHQGFNYLNKSNVFFILDTMTKINPHDSKLGGIKYRMITEIEKKSH